MPPLKPSPVEGKPETLEKNLPGKQLVGLEPTTSRSVVELFSCAAAS